MHLRSSCASGTESTAFWVNQYLASHGSDAISSVLKLRRVEPNEMSKTPQGRRERKYEATTSVEVDDLVGKVVNCEQGTLHSFNKEENFTAQEQNDPFIDQAAGLLITLGTTVA